MFDENDDDYSRGYRSGMSLQKPSSEDNKSQAFEDGYILALINRLETILYRQPNSDAKDKDA